MTASTARALTPSKPGMYRALRSAGSGIHAGSDRDALKAQRPARMERMPSEYAPFSDSAGKPHAARAISCTRRRLRDLRACARKQPHFVELGEVARDRAGFPANEEPDRALAVVVCGVRHPGADRTGLPGGAPAPP